MKKFNYLLMFALVALTTSFVSCDDKNSGGSGEITKTALTGDITENTTIAENATISGKVVVKSGYTLTIKPGVTITADATDLSYILVEQGAKIMAVGSESAPIVFTSTSEVSGAWGGLHICGYAPINSGATGSSEIGGATYGGTDAADNSGTLQYVSVRYSGTTLDAEHEANGISFYGVGNGTTVDHVEIYLGNDDGIEFFGGTVNIKYVKVYGAMDDSFDWTEGWSGKGQFLTAVQIPGGDRGIEGDNLASNNLASPYANPTLSQVTLIGDGTDEGYGMKLREGTKGKIYNFVVTGFDKRSINIEHDQTITNLNNGELVLDYGKVNNAVTDKAIKYSTTNVSVASGKEVEASSNIDLLNLTTIDATTTYIGGKDISTMDPFFESSTQIGAGADWTNWMASNGMDGNSSTLNIVTELSGDITTDTYVFENATLTGEVNVKAGATLYISEGVTITADASDLSFLLIEQGAKIVAEGTAAHPIVLTATLAEAGAWGGLHICGKAPINSGATGNSEIGGATYGGTDAADNSGVLEYVRVEYSGTTLDAEHEANGISFYGVGNGTTVNYIQIYMGNDDGIEFFGGTVNIKHVYVYGAMDDSFDWTEGWSGKGQYLIAVQTPGGDRGIEGDNLASDNSASPFANPTLSQVTLIGDGENEGYGMKLREGTKGKIYNFVVTGFDKRSINIEHDVTITNLNNGELVLDYGKVNNVVSDAAIKYSTTNVTVAAGKEVEASANIVVADFSAANKSYTYTGGKDLSADSFFESTTQIGAGDSWTTGWTR